MRLNHALGVLAFTAILLVSGVVAAYPQFQFSTDNVRCSECHFSPSGGGLINAWGREEAADTISRGGDGTFLNDLLETPNWLTLGGDFRAVAGARYNEANGPDRLIFPMQADIYTRASFGANISLNLTIGLRGAARNAEAPPHSRVVSRQHNILWQPKTTGSYIQAGRFYAPYGLRQVDHTNYIRRDLGFYAIEETYGLTAGYLKDDDWELHLSAFTRDPILKVGPAGHGASALYEKRFRDNTAAWGLQSKVQLQTDSTNYWGGTTIKYWIDSLNLLVLGEADVGVATIDTPGADPILKGIAHLNLTYFITTGLMLGTTIEAKHTDLKLRGKDSESATLTLQYFPKAHYELVLLGKVERTRQTSDLVSFFMFHYYL